MGVGLLAPVPSPHLGSALETCQKHGKVAFGSMKTEVFDVLERDFGIPGIPVYIYASTRHGPPYTHADNGRVSLQATLANVEEADDQGRHPNPLYRPQSTFEPEKRGLEIWWCFWEVSQLQVIPKQARIAITKFTAFNQTRPLQSAFVPFGPMIVKAAFIP